MWIPLWLTEVITQDTEEDEAVGQEEENELDSHRLLEDNPSQGTGAESVRTTFIIYGSIFLVLLVMFCYVRQRYPRAYNVRNSVPELNCELAKNQFGYISWMWNVFFIRDHVLFEQCGMDAVCFIRMMRFGLKVSVVGICNSVYLLPIFGTAPVSDETSIVDDNLERLTLGNIPAGDARTIATVFASYIIFGFTMRLIIKEFEWFTKYRHRFLSAKRPDNYTVYVGGIPDEYKSSAALLDYFRGCYSYHAVLEAQIALDIPQLEKKVAQREGLVTKLEHALALQEIKGITPMHKMRMCGGKKVDSIDAYTTELKKMNEDIGEHIVKIEQMHIPRSYEQDLEEAQRNSVSFQPVQRLSTVNTAESSVQGASTALEIDTAVQEASAMLPAQRLATLLDDSDSESQDSTFEETRVKKKKGHRRKASLESLVDGVRDTVTAGGTKLASGGAALASNAAAIVLGGEDGSPRDAGFVSFASLKATQSALQMIHHPKPFKMSVQEAPKPEDIFWSNVGLTNKSRQLGTLLGVSLTALLCLFWTIPVTFVSSLSEVSALKELLPFLEEWIENAPWLEELLAQLAPLLLLVLIALLPTILLLFAKLEGHIAESTLQASLFSKLATFMIIQTFFVSALSGGIMSELKKMIDDPTSIIDLLATSLPTESSYFMQILMAQTFIGLSVELLRIVPLAIALLHSMFGPNLTEKERNSVWLGLNPLSNPRPFEHAQVLAELVLYFMVLFVYSAMAPLTSYITAFNFILLAMGYRNQFIYVYPTCADSGGKLWTRFVRVILAAMIIAELTLMGVLSLKRSPVSVGLFVPLIVCTVLFIMYINQKHFYVTDHLPTRECITVDIRNLSDGGMNYDFVRGKYIQPAMQTKLLLPENADGGREIVLENINYFTPPGSEVEAVDGLAEEAETPV